jgi:HEAT repeat protein
MRTQLAILGVLLSSSVVWAGRGASTGSIKNAIASNSADAIVAELERAEKLACISCTEPVLKLVDHPSARVRDAAAWWLGKRGARVEVIEAMKARLTAEDPIAARNAADILAGMRDRATLPALSVYMMNPLDEASGAAAARAIGAIGHPAGLVPLKGAFAHPLAGVRAAALQHIRDLRAPVGAKAVTDAAPLLPMLSDADPAVRRQAALTIGFVQDLSAAGALSTVLATDAVPVVRKAAAWALGQIGAGADALAAAKNDADPLVRSVATAALGRLK